MSIEIGSTDGIEVGDWVVAGTTREDRDVGEIVALDGDTATVQWSYSGPTDIDISARDVEIYSSESDARSRAGM